MEGFKGSYSLYTFIRTEIIIDNNEPFTPTLLIKNIISKKKKKKWKNMYKGRKG